MSESENDNDAVRASDTGTSPDPDGQAAMLLVETLIHGLIERSVITVADAVGFAESAADVREEIGHERNETPDAMLPSLTILRAIASSLRFDLNGQPLKSVD